MLNIWCGKTGKMCLPDGKKFYDLYVAVWTEYRRVTDGQTKGQTDRQTIIFSQHSPHYAYASRGKTILCPRDVVA